MYNLPVELFKQHKTTQYKLGLCKGDCFCPICGSFTNEWLIFGKAHKTKCQVCGSLGRHRHLFWRMAELDLFGTSKKILHIAPEPLLRNILLSLDASNYYDCDIQPGRARLCMDITNIDFESNFFDLVICNHVLEHIRDDSKAVSELARVLTYKGTALITVPILSSGETYQDDTADTPEKRIKAHRHFDHVRAYGLIGFRKLLEQNGFNFIELNPNEYAQDTLLSMSQFQDTIFKCTKTQE